ncbi:hypothetical protein BJF78_13700 [Pseudonocardia sp. CNS-139]|nr:hypothetical protein BJF78_13700 [Pseudonocardia sp. CNS-139]
MDCRRCREILSARLDREAALPEIAAAERHLARCARCRVVAQRFAELADLTSAAPQWAVPGEDDPALLALAVDLIDRSAGTCSGAVGGLRRPRVHLVVPEGAPGAAGPAGCGCAASCACGCQEGRPCRCGSEAA